MPNVRNPSAETADRKAVRHPGNGVALLLIDVINDMRFDGSELLVDPCPSDGGAARAAQGTHGAGRDSVDLRQRQLRPVAVGFPQARGALHHRRCARPAHRQGVPTCAGRLLRVQTDALGLLRDHARHAARTVAGLHADRDRGGGNICVLFTASDAYMREYKLTVPADCVVSNTDAGESVHAHADAHHSESGRDAIERPGTLSGASRHGRTSLGGTGGSVHNLGKVLGWHHPTLPVCIDPSELCSHKQNLR